MVYRSRPRFRLIAFSTAISLPFGPYFSLPLSDKGLSAISSADNRNYSFGYSFRRPSFGCFVLALKVSAVRFRSLYARRRHSSWVLKKVKLRALKR